MSVLSHPHFHDEAAAFEYVEAALWPQGPVCPHCGCTGRISPLAAVRGSKSKKNPEGAIRHGLKNCGDCRKQFTVRVGTIFEESQLPMTKWLQAIFLMCSCKKGVSSHQLHRTLETTYKTAWFLAHRIREAMRSGELGAVRHWRRRRSKWTDLHRPRSRRPRRRTATRQASPRRSRCCPSSSATAVAPAPSSSISDDLHSIIPIVEANMSREARLRTDESRTIRTMGRSLRGARDGQPHREEYVRRNDPTVHTNTMKASSASSSAA